MYPCQQLFQKSGMKEPLFLYGEELKIARIKAQRLHRLLGNRMLK